MPSPTPARRLRPADRKRQLVDRAALLFVERGYAQVSLADIARAAGVTAPSLYRHFDDKQTLLYEAVLAGSDELEAVTEGVLEREPDEFIEAICRLGVRNSQSVTLWRHASRHLSPEQNREVLDRTKHVLRQWAKVLSAGRDDLTDAEAMQLAWAALSVVGSLSVHRTRVPAGVAAAELMTLVRRLTALSPSHAPAPPTAPPLPDPGPPTRRDEILDAAAGLFAQRGYSGVGVDEIGAAVGISGPSVYKHFPSKLAILATIGYRSAARLEAGVMAAYAAPGTPAELLARLVDSYVGVITASPDLSVAFNNAPSLPAASGGSDLYAIQRDYVSRWIDLLVEAQPELSPQQAAIAVHAALSIVNDAMTIRRGSARPEFAGLMAYLMKGALDV